MSNVTEHRLIFMRFPGCETRAIEAGMREHFLPTHRFSQDDAEPKVDAVFESLRRAASLIDWMRLSHFSRLLIDNRHFYSGECGYGFHAGLPKDISWKYLAVISDPVERVATQMSIDRVAGHNFATYSEWVAYHKSCGRYYYADNYQCRCLLADGWLRDIGEVDAPKYQRVLKNIDEGIILTVASRPPQQIPALRQHLGLDISISVDKFAQIEPFTLSESEKSQIRLDNVWDTKLFEFVRSQ